jgi:hypothetical protein
VRAVRELQAAGFAWDGTDGPAMRLEAAVASYRAALKRAALAAVDIAKSA